MSSQTAERLLEAGREELRAVGAQTLTIRTVAQRAGLSPATAYTYLASKNRLYAELFWRFLLEDAHVEPDATDATDANDAVERVRWVTRGLAHRLAAAPELAAAVTPALLGADPEVDELRLRIGAELVRRFEVAVGEGAAAELVEALTLAFSGALLQAGMGLMTYAEMADRLDAVVAVIMRGNR